MTDKFKVGDRVKVIGGIFKGQSTKILAQRSWRINQKGERLFVYEIDVSCETCHCGSVEKNLAPLYDGYEKTTWEELAPYWKPKQLEKV